MSKTKVCRACGEAHEIDDFYRHATSPGGRMARCKFCVILGRTIPGRGVLTDDQKVFIRTNYPDYGRKWCSEKLGVPPGTIGWFVHSEGIKCKRQGRPRKAA